MTERIRVLISTAVLAVVLASCAGPRSDATSSGTLPGQVSTHGRTSPASPGTHQAVTLSYALLTHCGIDEARIGRTYFEADHPLSGVAHSAPPGWATPYQQGTMTLVSLDVAVFRDDVGHRVRFHARAGATAFKRLCL